MKRAFAILAPTAFLFSLVAQAQIIGPKPPNQTKNQYYSPDEYRLAHSMFDNIRADLYTAQTNAYPNNLGDSPRFDIAHHQLQALERNWDQGRYDSSQIGNTIAAIEIVLKDNRLRPHDRDVLGRDLSRLIDFQSEYY